MTMHSYSQAIGVDTLCVGAVRGCTHWIGGTLEKFCLECRTTIKAGDFGRYTLTASGSSIQSPQPATNLEMVCLAHVRDVTQTLHFSGYCAANLIIYGYPPVGFEL